jgi:hypothetical protein
MISIFEVFGSFLLLFGTRANVWCSFFSSRPFYPRY